MKDFTSNVQAFIETLTTEGNLQPHDKLPSERDFIKAFNTSRVTLREALVDLENIGFIYRRNRHGWFLAPNRYVINPAQKSNFNEFATQQQLAPSTQTLFCVKSLPDAKVAKSLAIRKNQQVFHLRRIRSVGKRPILLEDIFVSAKQFTGLDQFDLSESLTQLMKHTYEIEIGAEENHIAIDLLDQEQATCLEVYPGAPCIKFCRSRLDQQGNPVEYDVERYLHNSIEMLVNSR